MDNKLKMLILGIGIIIPLTMAISIINDVSNGWVDITISSWYIGQIVIELLIKTMGDDNGRKKSR